MSKAMHDNDWLPVWVIAVTFAALKGIQAYRSKARDPILWVSEVLTFFAVMQACSVSMIGAWTMFVSAHPNYTIDPHTFYYIGALIAHMGIREVLKTLVRMKDAEKSD